MIGEISLPFQAFAVLHLG